jgi:RNA polymerase-binding transcription factor
MSAKKAVTKKKSKSVSSKKAAKKAKPKASASRSGKTSARKTLQKPSSKKTVKSPKSTSRKKVSKEKLSAPRGHSKTVAKQASGVSKKVAPRPSAPLPPVHARPAATPLKRRSSGSSVLSGPVRGFTPYQPKRGEEYMNRDQLEHFRQLLLAWKRELMEEVDRTMLHMKDDAANFPDPNDRATQESEFGLELRTRDRERKLLKKIDSALARIDDGSYGYCEETGDEIGLRRLEARPVATLCVEAQERRELAERQFRDREDQYR